VNNLHRQVGKTQLQAVPPLFISCSLAKVPHSFPTENLPLHFFLLFFFVLYFKEETYQRVWKDSWWNLLFLLEPKL